MAFDKNGRWVYTDEQQAILDSRPVIEDISIGLKAGIRDAGEETLQVGKKLADYAIETAGDVTGYGWEGFEDNSKRILPQVLRPTGMAGKFTEDLTQFTTGFLGVGKFIRPLKGIGWIAGGKKAQSVTGGIIKTTQQSAVATALVSNPYEDRLSNFIQEYPHLENPITEYLQADPEDTYAEGKLKAGLEDLPLSLGVEYGMRGIMTIARGFKKADNAIAKGDDPVEATKLDQDEINDLTVQEGDAVKAGTDETNQLKASAKVEQENVDAAIDAGADNLDTIDLTATKTIVGKRLMQASADNGENYAKTLKSFSKKDLLVIAKQVGVKTGQKNKKQLFDEINYEVFKGVKYKAKPKAETVTVNAKVAESGVQAPQAVKLSAKALKQIEKQPENISEILKEAKLYDPKTFNPDDPTSVVRDLVAMVQKQNPAVIAAVKGQQTWKQAEEETANRVGDLLNLDNNQLSTLVTNYSKTTEDATFVLGAVESIMKSQFDEITERFTKSNFDTDRKAQMEALEALESTMMILQSVSGQEAAFGRALNLRKKGVIDLDSYQNHSAVRDGGDHADAAAMDYLIKQYGGIDKLHEIKVAVLAAKGNPKAFVKILKNVQEPTGKKVGRSVIELFRSMILFNTKTHITNILGGGIESVLRPIEGYIGSYMTMKMFGAEAKAQRDFFGAQLEGLLHSMDAAAVVASRSFMMERNILDTMGKVDDLSQMNKISSEYWPEAKGSPLGAVLDMTGKAARVSLRTLGAEDEFFKQINYRGRIYAQSKMDGMGKGLKDKDLTDYISKEIDDAFDASGAAVKNKDGTFKHSKALHDAREATFTSELTKGTMANGLHKFVNQHPSLQLFMPFIRTPTNLIGAAVQRTPILGALSKKLRADFKNPDPAIRAAAKGKWATGIAIYGMAYSMVNRGDITGSGPLDPEANRTWRAAGNQAYSVKMGDSWVSYQRLDPNFIPFALVANLNDAVKHGTVDILDIEEWDGGMIQEALVGTILSIVKTIEDKAYFQGITSVAAAFTSENPAQKHSLERIGSNFVTSVIPPAPLQFAEVWDDLVNGQPAEVREAVGLIEKIQRKWITTNKDLPKKYNWLTGEPMINYGSFSGIPIRKDEPNAVMDELVRQKVGFRGPTKRFGALKFDLTNEEFSRYQQLAGTSKFQGRTLLQNLAKLHASPVYKAAAASFEIDSEGFSRQVVLNRKIISKHLALARELLKDEFPELGEEVKARRLAQRTGMQLMEFNR
jgi:hypothetical protein